MQAIGGAMDALREQAVTEFAAGGVDPEAFYAWATTHKARAMTSAMMAHYQSRTTAPYASLLRAFKEANPVKIEAPPVNVGHNTIPRAATEPMVNIPGYGLVREKVARRIGLIQ